MSEKDIKKNNVKNTQVKHPAEKQTAAKQSVAKKPATKRVIKSVSEAELKSGGKAVDQAFPVSKSTLKDQSKTSVGYTAFAVLLYILAFVPLVGATVALALKTYNALPAYGFWHFIALIVLGVFGLIFATVTLIVTRKSSKSSIFSQTAKVAVTFVVLTTVFGMILTYIVPDVIEYFTSNTLFAEDLYYNADDQIEKHVQIERDYIMYNILSGNLNDFNSDGTAIKTQVGADGSVLEVGDYSYKTLSKRNAAKAYVNAEIDATYREYLQYDKDTLQEAIIDPLADSDPRKYELYEFVYTTYILNDYDYALNNNAARRALGLAIVDFIYNHSSYTTYLKEGFGNARLKELFDSNYNSFNHDGYNTFDDPLLLYAQMNGRMTVPVVLRLILNEGWNYTQGAFNEETGSYEYAADGELLYQLYDKDAVDAFKAAGGTFDAGTTTLAGLSGEFNYGRNEQGWLMFENGYVKRPMNWMVLDMLGDPMDLTSIDLSGIELMPGFGIDTILNLVFNVLGGLPDALGGLLEDDLGSLIEYATNGANLNINICINDASALAISISPKNIEYGMLGYQWATWMQSNNLLMAVINVLNVREWLYIFGGIGVLLIAAAGVLRECGKRTRERTAASRDRIERANALPEGELKPVEEKKEDDKKDKKGKKDDKASKSEAKPAAKTPASKPVIAKAPAKKPVKK